MRANDPKRVSVLDRVRQDGLLQVGGCLLGVIGVLYAFGCAPQPGQVATPTFSPEGGSFTDSVDVTIACATEGATIRYTTDGSDPNGSSAECTGAIHLTSTTTLKARAFMAGMTDSEVASATFTIAVPTPTFTPNGGSFLDWVDVTIGCATASAAIRYTTDGSDPTPSHGTVYADPIRLTATTTVKAIAYKSGLSNSAVASATFTVNVATTYNFVRKWGSFGTGDGEFQWPQGVAVDSAGNVYVADLDNDRIQKFTSTGSFLTKWGSNGTGDGQFDGPAGVAVDSAGNVYVADGHNDRIQKFSSTGTFIRKWGSNGTGDREFQGPGGVAVDSAGNVYVADWGNHRIQKFTSTGSFITKWGSNGTGDGQFKEPAGMAVDSAGNVYVADGGNGRVQKFTSTGSFITKWGSNGTGDGQFDGPGGVAVDSAGNVYVGDFLNHRIQQFAPAP